MNRFYQKYVASLLGILLVLSLIVPAVSAESVEGKIAQESNQVDTMLADVLSFYGTERFDKQHFPWGDPQELSWTEVVALQASSSLLTDGTLELPEWIEKDPGFEATTGDTDHIRYIFGLIAVGKDPTSAWETNRNLLVELAAQQKEDGSIGGANKHAWAMLALNTGEKLDYTTDQWTSANKKQALEHLLSLEIPSGGFALWGDKADPDMTAMVLLSLADYQDEPVVQQAIKRTLESLHNQQMDSAGWGTGTKANSNSIATVISGLIAVQEDPLSASWKKNGLTPVDALKEFQLDNGAFVFMLGGKPSVNLKSTEQSLVALQEIKDGQSIWQQLADSTSTNQNPTIQNPENVKSTIENGRLHFQIKNAQSGEWKPAKVDKKQVVGKYMTIQISESTTVVEGTKLPSGEKKIVVIENDRSYTYFDADLATAPEKKWEVKFSAPLLDTDTNLKNVTVQNADGQNIAMTVELLSEDTVVKIKPSYDYKPGELFYITISDVLSAKDTVVKKPIRKIFVIKE